MPRAFALLVSIAALAVASASASMAGFGGPPGGSSGAGIGTINGDATVNGSTGAMTVTGCNGAPCGTSANANASSATGVAAAAFGSFAPGDLLVARDAAGTIADGGPPPFLNYRAGFQATNDGTVASALDFAAGAATDTAGLYSLSFSKPAATTLVGSVTSGATSGTVALAAGLAPGLQITIAGAGVASANLTTYITSVSGSTIGWKTATSTTVSGPALTPTGGCVVDLAGTNGAGALDTGSAANATTYHYFVMAGSAVPTACIASASLTPTPPSGYTVYRRIMSMRSQLASAIPLGFTEYGNDFLFSNPANDIAAVTLPTSNTAETLGSMPTGFSVEPLSWLSVSGSVSAYCITPGTSDTGVMIGSNAAVVPLVGLHTNASAQLTCKGSSASFTFTVLSRGFRNPLTP